MPIFDLVLGKNYEDSRTVWPLFRPCSKVGSPLLSALPLKHGIHARVLERPERFSSPLAVESMPPRFSGSAEVEGRGTGVVTTAANAAAERGYFRQCFGTLRGKISFFIVIFSFSVAVLRDMLTLRSYSVH